MKQTILITGASSGIGKETAKYFQDKGWNVIATMRNPEKETELTKLDNVLVTKLDVLTGIKEIPVCVAYDVDGVRTEEIPVSQSDFHHAKPIYEIFPGWDEDITGAKKFEDLPKNARDYVLALEKLSGTRISAIGVGPDRNATIVRHDLLRA